VQAKIALVFSFLFAFYLFADGIQVGPELDDVTEEESSSIDYLVISLRFKDSLRSRSRRSPTNTKTPFGFGIRSDHLLSAARVKKPPIFSQQELYSLQQVYRL